MSEQIDWMGRWYVIMKERGENDCPTLGRLHLKSGEIDWFHFSHSQMDGIGAFVKYYQEKGTQLQNLPQIKEKKVPGLIERLKIFYRLIFKTKKARVDWKEFHPEAAPKDPLDIHYKIFSPAQLAALKSYCKSQGFSLNAYFMNTLTRALLPELTHNQEGTWTLPVNLRPLLARKDFCSNHSSGILVSMNKDDTPSDTHKKIAHALKSKIHWGIWWIHQIGKFVGMRGMRYVSAQNAKKSFLIGSFSILGKWDFPKDHIWVGCAPGSKNFPVSAFLLEANDHLSFCLKIHPAVLPGAREEVSGALFKSAVDKILSPLDAHQRAGSEPLH